MYQRKIPELPLLRVLIPLAAGIWIQELSGSLLYLPISLMAASLILLLFCLLPSRFCRFLRAGDTPYSPWFGLFVMPACLFAGMLLNIGPPCPGNFPEISNISEGICLGRISSGIEQGGSGLRCTVDRIHLRQNDQWVPLRGKAALSLQMVPDGSGAVRLGGGGQISSGYNPGSEGRGQSARCGRWILFANRLKPYPESMNPHQFDYGRFQRGRGIHYQAWIPSRQWILSGMAAELGLRSMAIRFRKNLLAKLERHVPDPEARSVLNALVLGYRGALETTTREAFARSGVMHILAVSGLHVGILYILPSLMIRRMRPGKAPAWIAWIMVLLLLWGYAFLTGLSASVVRAVAMCSLHRAALLLGRHVPSLHILSLAALIMILARPSLLLEAGFLLSFTAVAGILLLHPLIDRRLQHVFPGWAGKQLRGMLSVSLAAQLATAPLAIYYFNQFSFGALLANFLVIPLAGIILYGGLLFFLLSGSVIVSAALGRVLEAMAGILLRIIRGIGELKGIFIEDCSLLAVQVFLLYLTGLAGYLYLKNRQPVSLITFLSCIVLCLGASLFRSGIQESIQQVQVYALRGRSAIGFLDGRDLFLYRPGSGRPGSSLADTTRMDSTRTDSVLSASVRSAPAVPYELRNLAGRYHTNGVELAGDRLFRRVIDSAGYRLEYIVFADKRLLLVMEWPSTSGPTRTISGPTRTISGPTRTISGPTRATAAFTEDTLISGWHLDLIVVTNNALPDEGFLSSVSDGATLILDGSNAPWLRRLAGDKARRCGITYHDVLLDGYHLSEPKK